MQKHKCNVVVLAAGLGTRFSNHGVEIPKPLIHFRGRSLLDRSLDVAREIAYPGGGRVIVVATHRVAMAAWRVLKCADGNDRVVPISVTQKGPAGSALMALAHLPQDEQVVFMDCDNYFPAEARSWVETIKPGNFIMLGERPAQLPATDFCNVHVKDGQAVDMHEKANHPSWPVAVGVYGFSTASSFEESAHLALVGAGAEVGMGFVLWASTRYVRAEYVEAWSPIGSPTQLEVAEKHGPQSPTSNE